MTGGARSQLKKKKKSSWEGKGLKSFAPKHKDRSQLAKSTTTKIHLAEGSQTTVDPLIYFLPASGRQEQRPWPSPGTPTQAS